MEVKRFHAKLKQHGIHVTINWLEACMEFLRDQNMIGPNDQRTLLNIQEQWLVTDIRTEGIMERRILPDNILEAPIMTVNGKLTLQVNSGVDIGSPAYGQLQKIHKINTENSRVSAEDSEDSQSGYQPSQGQYIAAWEPKPTRMLQLIVTDGFQTAKAIEHEQVECLPYPVAPGLKIELIGPVTSRRGVIFLTKNSLRVIGGSVDEMSPEFSIEKVLSTKIGKEDIGQVPFLERIGNNLSSRSNQRIANADGASRLLASEVQRQQPTVAATTSNSTTDRGTISDSGRALQSDVAFGTSSEADPFPDMDESMTAPEDLAQQHMLSDEDDDLFDSIMKSTENEEIDGSTLEVSSGKSYHEQPLTKGFSSLDGDHHNDRRPLVGIQPFTAAPLVPTQATGRQAAGEFLTVASEPFVYLSVLKSAIEKMPTRRFFVTVKVVSATLTSKLRLTRTEGGPAWNISLLLNDGSDFLQADFSPSYLDRELVPASDYAQSNLKEMCKERMKKFSLKLANLNALAKIRYCGPSRLPVIEEIEDLSGLHLAKMRRRRLH